MGSSCLVVSAHGPFSQSYLPQESPFNVVMTFLEFLICVLNSLVSQIILELNENLIIRPEIQGNVVLQGIVYCKGEKVTIQFQSLDEFDRISEWVGVES